MDEADEAGDKPILEAEVAGYGDLTMLQLALVVLLLFASATSTFAEGAWVLSGYEWPS